MRWTKCDKQVKNKNARHGEELDCPFSVNNPKQFLREIEKTFNED